MDILDRFRETRDIVSPVNSIGSALWYCGRLDEDKVVSSGEFYEKFYGDLEEVGDLVRGDLVAWERVSGRNRYLDHLAVVENLEPFFLVHRVDSFLGIVNGRARREEFDKVNFRYGVLGCVFGFYRFRG